MSQSIDREKEIFQDALALASAEARSEYLDAACGSDEPLRREIEALLRAHAGANGFIPTRSSAATLADRDGSPLSEGPGSTIDRYKLLQKIGEGGMGVVYMAEQETPVRRRVALKIIKLGMDTKQVVARFEAERQALALMDHPNIARVLDGGATETGRPYFVMELVQGVPMTEFCDKNRLSAKDRIKLFIPVCQAIQSAHQKGIIHRDIKPSNILVTLNGGMPVPKVIDFGVAKATNQKLTEKTLFTQYATMIGTPAYMSPEQAEMSSLDVDTRADVYSLGVLLYELLTGTTPFPEERLRSVGYGEMQRIIAEEEPVRPSTRLSTLQDEQRAIVARNHGANGLTPKDVFASDLDWIVMKCLEKDRARRYETANGLALDIHRHLENEPIIARPPSQLYRLQKFAKRNKVVFVAAMAVSAALVVGLGLATIGFVRARGERNQAVAAQREANSARAAAQLNAEKAREEELRSRQRAYVADMNLVQEAWKEGNLDHAQELLHAYDPQPNQPDLRGLEWRYLWTLCQDESQHSFTNFTESTRYWEEGHVALDLSPDGARVAAGSGHAIKLLDTANLRQLDEFLDPNDRITALAFSPTDTNLLATAGATNGIKLWNLEVKQPIAILPGAHTWWPAVAFSADGRLLAATLDGTNNLELWDVPRRTRIWARKTPQMPPSTVCFTPDGKGLLTGGGESGNALLWDLPTATFQPFPLEHKAWVNHAAFSPDGTTLATSSNDGTVILWNFATRTRLGKPLSGHRGAVDSVSFSPNGQQLASGGDDGTVRIWNVAGQQQAVLLRGHSSIIYSVCFAPDGQSIVSTGWHAVKRWGLSPHEQAEFLAGHSNWLHSVTFSPDGKLLGSVEYHEGRAKLWDVAARRVRADLASSSRVALRGVFSPDGHLYAFGGGDHTVQLWELPAIKFLAVLTNDFPTSNLSFSPDSRVIAVGGAEFGHGPGTNRLAFWDINSRRKLNHLARAGTNAASASFSNKGSLIAVGYFDGTLRIWDFQRETLLGEAKLHDDLIWSVTFSHDDKLVASAGGDNLVGLYDLASWRALKPLREHTANLWTVAFSPDDRTLASASDDGSVKLWNLATGRSALTLRQGIGSVAGVAFNPDGTLMASCGADAMVWLWRAAPFEKIQ